MFVIDASAMLPWVFDDENDLVATTAADRAISEDMAVPALWWFELRNGLIMGERRKRITPEHTQIFLGRLAGLTIVMDRSPEEDRVLGLARKHRLTAYDAAYLELARRRSLNLATLDTDLANAARQEGIDLIGHAR